MLPENGTTGNRNRGLLQLEEIHFSSDKKKNAVSPFPGGGNSIRRETLTGDLGQ
jgi:hypothetical protein